MATNSADETPVLCDFCDEVPPTKFCHNCYGSLCEQCAKDHTKGKIFRNHEVIDIGSYTNLNEIRPQNESEGAESELLISHIKSGEAESELSRCPKHVASELDSYCKACICFICEECRVDHIDHGIESAKDDAQLYHKVCRKHIQGLLDGVHVLDEFRQLVDEMFKAYDEAINRMDGWESELLDYIHQKAEELRSKLKKEKDQWVSLLTKLKQEATELQESADKEVNTLNEVRHANDCDMLSHMLAASQKMLDEISDFKTKNITRPEIPKVDKLLPHGQRIPLVKSGVDSIFAMDSAALNMKQMSGTPWLPMPGLSSIPKATLTSDRLKVKYGVRIDSNREHTYYKFCRGGTSSKIILHSVGNKVSDMQVFDSHYGLLRSAEHQCQLDIWEMVSLDEGRYVARDNTSNTFHLLGQTFQSIHKLTTTDGVHSIAKWSQESFISYECHDKKSLVSATISKWLVTNTEFKQVGQISMTLDDEIPLGFAVHADGMHAFLCSDSFLYKINMTTMSHTALDIAPYVKELFKLFGMSLATDGNNVLLGDADGVIHLFDAENNHEEIAKCDSEPRDMIVGDGKLIISTADQRILVFTGDGFSSTKLQSS